jgi:hypothetical protein
MQRARAGLISLMIVGIGAVLAPQSAGAGGWAVSTLDPVRAPVAGETTEVGFTIRQHGVRPASVDGKVGIGVESAAGAAEFFAAAPQGTTGHYVVRVEFPEPGSYRWSVFQGWFGEQRLGRIEVADAASVAVPAGGTVGDGGSGSTFRGPLSVRVLLPVLGLGFGIFAVAEAVRARRRRSGELVAP